MRAMVWAGQGLLMPWARPSMFWTAHCLCFPWATLVIPGLTMDCVCRGLHWPWPKWP